MENYVSFTTPDGRFVGINASIVRRIEAGESKDPSLATTVLWFDDRDHTEVLGGAEENLAKIIHYGRHAAQVSTAQQDGDDAKPSSRPSLKRVLG